MSKVKSKNVYAFTLIELLVGLTIVGLIFSFGFSNFRDFSRRQALLGEKRMVTGDLRLAQEQALSGNKPSDISCTSPYTLNGYNFDVVTDTSYKIQASCSGGNVDTKTADLSSGITISIPSPNPILFKSLGQGTNISSSGVTLTLTQAETGSTQTINITSTGEIK